MINKDAPSKLKKALSGRISIGGRSTNGQLEIQLFGTLKKKQAAVIDAIKEVDHLSRTIEKLESDYIYDHRPPVSWSGGFTMIPNEVICSTDLTEPVKLTWLILFMFAFDRKSSWPSISRIASLLGKSTRQTQRYLVKLVRRGYITVQLKKDLRSGNIHNVYTFNIEDLISKNEKTLSTFKG